MHNHGITSIKDGVFTNELVDEIPAPPPAPHNPLSDLVVWMKYARHNPALKRRETWTEICDRNRDMHLRKFPELRDVVNRIYDHFIIPKKILPSMRSMQFAGAAIDQHNTRMFNCAFAPVDSVDVFGEIMFLLLGGTGMGYSVQNLHISKLPPINRPWFPRTDTYGYTIQDSIEGWGDAIKELLYAYTGSRHRWPKFDFSQIREKGALLVTSGGKAPGPEPLRIALERIEEILISKQEGTQLNDIEVHDIICHIADAVYAGGIRRAALICLFDRNSEAMLSCKSTSTPTVLIQTKTERRQHGELVDIVCDIAQNGRTYRDVKLSAWDYNNLLQTGTLGWWVANLQRSRANNSAVLIRNEVSKDEFLQIWQKVKDSGSGEPGVYWTNNPEWGTNPCVETALRPFQFCNLVEINASNIADIKDMYDRVWAATIIGTLQASYTDFNYLRNCWRENTEKDALLGVSMTGLASQKIEQLGINLHTLAQWSTSVNATYAKQININPSARITCVKPAGTTSLTLGTSSGIHAWHDEYYIRRIRLDKKERLYDYLIKYHPGVVEDDVTNVNTAIISIPQAAPEGALIRAGETAIDMLERIKAVYQSWVLGGHNNGTNTHNISATISLKDQEWDEVGEWMWGNCNAYNGISVLPFSEHSYKQAPFESITKEQYEEMVKNTKVFDLTNVLEDGDETQLAFEQACAGGVCDL